MEICNVNIIERQPEEMCRLCLSLTERTDAISIFSPNNGALSLDTLIRDCIALEVSIVIFLFS